MQNTWKATQFFPHAINNSPPDMAYLGYRLATLSALPPSVSVSKVKLADAGFYFRGQDDRVFCYRCKGSYSGWREGDKPLDIHRRISPTCPHVMEMSKQFYCGETNSVNESGPEVQSLTQAPLQFEPLQSKDGELQGSRPQQPEDSRQEAVYTTSSAGMSGTDVAIFPRPTLDLGGAVYPMYQDIASRTRSYTSWDERRAPPLKELILCGMYYAGYDDCVRCFYCGVGLKAWEVTDNVWTEHIRGRSNCGYVRAIKGDNYIRQVLEEIKVRYASNALQGQKHWRWDCCRSGTKALEMGLLSVRDKSTGDGIAVGQAGSVEELQLLLKASLIIKYRHLFCELSSNIGP